MRCMYSKAFVLSLLMTAWNTQAAVYQEVGGRVVVEAEHFDSRAKSTDDDPAHEFKIAPDELTPDEASAPAGQYLNARGGKYVVVLPDSGQNRNSTDLQTVGPHVDYKVQITTTGEYQLYIRDAAYDGASDSFYTRIVELQTDQGGPGPNWYRYAFDPTPAITDFNETLNNDDDATSTAGWIGYSTAESSGGGAAGDRVPTLWTISKAGTYTIRIEQREDGNGVDAVLLQRSNLPIPARDVPESPTSGTFILINKQPTNITVNASQTATFVVDANGSSTISYQWQKAPPGSTNFADVPGATSASYTTPAATVADSGTQYRVAMTVTGANAISKAATLTVDVTSPTVVNVLGSPTFDRVTVRFSEAVTAATGTNPANYTISGLTISRVALDAKQLTATVFTSNQTTNGAYTATIKDVKDLVGNTVSPNPTTRSFHGFVLSTGGALHKFWESVNGNTIASLTGDARFPNSPTFSTIEPGFEYPPNGGNEAGSNYGNQLSALLIPPVTGDYIFYVNSDDPSELYLSTDENPANKVLIASEIQWGSARLWITSDNQASRGDPPSNISNPISLVAGKRYYIEALHTEGGGGDNVGATWHVPGAPDVVNGDPPIPGSALATYVSPDVLLEITQQPVNASANANSSVTFSVRYIAEHSLGTNAAVQWQKAPPGSSTFTDIAGANAVDYTIAFANSADNGAKFRAVLSVGTVASKTSDAATLTVITDNTPPTLTSAVGTITAVRIGFSEPLDAASAADKANYAIDKGVTVNAAAVVTPADKAAIVQLTVSGATVGTLYTVTVNNVKDRAGNAIAASSKFQFVAWNAVFDFNDGATPAGTTIYNNAAGDAKVLATGGIDNTGVLRLTRPVGNQQSSFVVNELEPGKAVSAFTVTFKLFIGQGSGNAADGFSFNYAADVADADFGEEGSGSGLSVLLDTYDNGGGEAPAVDVKWNGTEVATTKVPKARLVNNQWADVLIRLNADGTLDVVHNGTNYYTKLAIPGFTPITGGKIGIGARTGGEWQLVQVDNFAIANAAFDPPTITPPTNAPPPKFTSIVRDAGGVTFSWTGTGALQAADTVNGPWVDIAGAASPRTVPTTAAQKFYRIKQ